MLFCAKTWFLLLCSNIYEEITFLHIFPIFGQTAPGGGDAKWAGPQRVKQRGSPHGHMVMWIKDAPKYDISTDDEVIQYIDTHISCSTQLDPDHLIECQTS